MKVDEFSCMKVIFLDEFVFLKYLMYKNWTFNNLDFYNNNFVKKIF